MSNDKYGNETMKIDGKWTLVQPQSGMYMLLDMMKVIMT